MKIHSANSVTVGLSSLSQHCYEGHIWKHNGKSAKLSFNRKDVPRTLRESLIRVFLITIASLSLLIPSAIRGEILPLEGSRSRASSASIDIRINIPAVIMVLENSHPMQLGVSVDDTLEALQQLVVHSTMQRGFCVSLHLDISNVEVWHVDMVQEAGITLSKVVDGYRLCTSSSGKYILRLQHTFVPKKAKVQIAEGPIMWPVRTDVTTY